MHQQSLHALSMTQSVKSRAYSEPDMVHAQRGKPWLEIHHTQQLDATIQLIIGQNQLQLPVAGQQL